MEIYTGLLHIILIAIKAVLTFITKWLQVKMQIVFLDKSELFLESKGPKDRRVVFDCGLFAIAASTTLANGGEPLDLQ